MLEVILNGKRNAATISVECKCKNLTFKYVRPLTHIFIVCCKTERHCHMNGHRTNEKNKFVAVAGIFHLELCGNNCLKSNKRYLYRVCREIGSVHWVLFEVDLVCYFSRWHEQFFFFFIWLLNMFAVDGSLTLYGRIVQCIELH